LFSVSAPKILLNMILLSRLAPAYFSSMPSPPRSDYILPEFGYLIWLLVLDHWL
jgi:hypothetical protein